jgi:hypothetical protein
VSFLWVFYSSFCNAMKYLCCFYFKLSTLVIFKAPSYSIDRFVFYQHFFKVGFPTIVKLLPESY